MKNFLVLASLAISCLQVTVKAQNTISNRPVVQKNNNISFELGGSHLYYALGYERVLLRAGRFSFYGRVAGSFMPLRDNLFLETDKRQLAYSIETGLAIGSQRHQCVVGFSYNYTYYYYADFDLNMPVATGDFRYMDIKTCGLRIAYRHNFHANKFRFDIGASPSYMLQKRKDTYYDGNTIQTFPDIGTRILPWCYIGFGINF